MECNIHKFFKRFPRQTIHTYHPPQTFPFPMTKFHPHAVPNESRQIPFIPPQNEKGIFANLQLSWKGGTNGQTPYDRVQPILK